MHGRTRAALTAVLIASALPATASAAQMPAGTYDGQLTGGTLNLGLLPQLPIPQSATFPLTIGTAPVNAQAPGFTLPAQNFNDNVVVGTLSGSYTITVETLKINLDPTSGSATVDTSGYASIDLTFTPAIGSPISGTCTLGSAQSPITLALSTADGSAWDPSSKAMTLVDKTFTLPTPSCDSSLSAAVGFLTTFIGGTTPGSNALTMIFNLIQRPTSQTQGGSGGTGGTGGQQGGGQQGGTPTTPQSQPQASRCTVPKLKGKRFATRKAKRKLKARLKKAGCRLGKVKQAKSNKRKGTVIRQRPKAGKKLPKGSRVSITISRGR